MPPNPSSSDQPPDPRPWYKRIAWFNLLFSIIIPFIALLEALRTPLHPKTAVFAIVYFWATGLTITAGVKWIKLHREAQ